MKKCFAIILQFVSATTFAAPTIYKINAEFLVDGVLISSPQINCLAGKTAEITQSSKNSNYSLKIKLLPEKLNSDKIENAISMKFEIEYTHGTRSIKSSPHIITKLGSKASISIGNQINENVELKVIATSDLQH